MVITLAKNGRPNYCLVCIGNMAIRCGWCGKTIDISDMITLYLENPDMPEWTRYYGEAGASGRKRVIGCGRSDCAETGADYCGQWLPPGEVVRFQSVLEKMIEANQNGDDCTVVVASFERGR